MSELGPLIVRRTVTAPHEQVWQMIVDDVSRASWWPELEMRPEIGAPLTSGDLAGAVDVVVNDLTFGFRWRRPQDDSDRTVVMMLRPEDDNVEDTRVTVIESGFAVLPDAAEVVRASTTAWESRCDALVAAITPESDAPDHSAVALEGDVHEVAADHEAGADHDAPPVDEVSSEDVAAQGDADVVEYDRPAAAAPDAGADVSDELARNEDATDREADDVEPNNDAVDDDVLTDTDESEIDVSETDMVEIDVTEGDEVGVFTAEVITDTGDRDIIEIMTDDVVDAETIEETPGIYLPEVSGAPFTESVVQITSDLGVSEPVEVDETSEWERLLRGDTLDGDR